MGSTNPQIGVQLLGAMSNAGVEYALLHNAGDLLRDGHFSDIDVAVAESPFAVIRKLQDAERRHCLTLAMIWQYDVNSFTTFWLSTKSTDGIQLDLLCDPHGRGSYGLQTGIAIAAYSERFGTDLRALCSEARLVYLLSKRLAKGDLARAYNALESLASFNPPTELRSLMTDLLSQRRMRAIFRQLRSPTHVTPTAARRAQQLRRIGIRSVWRTVVPTGSIVNLPYLPDDRLFELKSSLARIFPRVAISRWPASWPESLVLRPRRPTVVLRRAVVLTKSRTFAIEECFEHVRLSMLRDSNTFLSQQQKYHTRPWS